MRVSLPALFFLASLAATISSVTLATAQVAPSYVSEWGTQGSGDGQFRGPLGAATSLDGSVFVADTENHRIQKFTNNGTFLLKWGAPGSGDGQFSYPYGLAVEENGDVYVADFANHRVQKFSSNGTFVMKWGTQGSSDGLFSNPTQIAVGGGYVYVVDYGNNRIQKFTTLGVFVQKWSVGSAPVGVALDGHGNVYVSCIGSPRVQKYTTDGGLVTQWGAPGSGNGLFVNSPRGMAVDAANQIFVVDTGNHRIQQFTTEGAFVLHWGANGTGPGMFINPWDVKIGPGGRLYVVDTYNHRVQQYGVTTPLVWTLSAGATGNGIVVKSPDRSSYADGEIVTVTASPSVGWRFIEWTGSVSSTANPLQLTMDANKSVTARFEQDHYTLDVTVAGGGTVERLPNTATYVHGEVVRLTAVPHPGWAFAGWSGAATGTASPINVTIFEDTSVMATFVDTGFPTVHAVYPNGGEILVVGSDYKFTWEADDEIAVESVDLEISRDGGAHYETIAAEISNAGSYIWTVTGLGTNTNDAPEYAARFRVTARDGSGNTIRDESDGLFALHDLVPHHIVALTSLGKGVVGRAPDQARYLRGSTLSLTAAPELGWEFVGWSGDTTASGSPLDLVVGRNLELTATFRDAVPPVAAVVYPNGGQILVPGSNYKLAWHATDGENVAGVDLSVSRDDGATWQTIATGVPNTGTYVWLASRPGGNSGANPVFSSWLRVTARDSAGNAGSDQSDQAFAIHDLAPLAVEEQPVAFAVASIAPNPATIAAVVTYQLPEDAPIRMSVHDLQGRQVAVLATGMCAAGTHRATWRSKGARNGVYFVRYETPRGVISRRIVVAR